MVNGRLRYREERELKIGGKSIMITPAVKMHVSVPAAGRFFGIERTLVEGMLRGITSVLFWRP